MEAPSTSSARSADPVGGGAEATGTRVHLCGQLRIEVGGRAREAELRGRQGRLLLALLVLRRQRPVRRDELAEALARNGAGPSATTLAPVLSRLRGALAPGTIEGRDTLQLVLPEPVWVDVEEAERRLAAAREAFAAGDAAAAAEAAQEAAALLASDVLPGADAPWLDDERAQLGDLRVAALELAGSAGAQAGGSALPDAERAAREAVAAAPFRESARAALIEILRAQGNVAEAVRAYEDVRALLRDELGTVPGPELVALHEQLLGLGDTPPPAPAPRARLGRTGGPRALVERDAELGEIDAALARTAAGTGGVLVLEGPAGIGKTWLLSELRARAEAARLRVLDARAGVLEREYAFGVARQLLEHAATAPGVLDGPAAAARAVVTEAGSAGGGDSFSALNALVHVTARLAAGTPLVLCVDDLQWSDPASLRFVAYLARRVAPLPVLVAATVRTGEPDVDDALLAEIANEPVSVVLRPAPLSAAGTAGLVRARLGDATEDAFAAACQEVTGGNPLLVGQLLSALASEHVPPDAAHAAQVRSVGPRAVSRTLLLRLARLPTGVIAVARAVAVLGEGPDLRAVAALAGTGEVEAADAVDALIRADILRDDEPLGFVHPLVRDAVYGELAAARRGLEHARAARVLAELGAPPEPIAAQLAVAPPRGDPWVVERLREAARFAVARGAPDSAMSHLQRAQAEPPSPETQPQLALELGATAALVSGPAGVEPLRRAHASLTDPAARGRAAFELGRLLLFVGSPPEAVALIERAAAELPDDEHDTRDGLMALRMFAVHFGAVDPAELVQLDPVVAGPRRQGPGSKMLTAIAGWSLALSCGAAQTASALARETLDGPVFFDGDIGIFTPCAGMALALGEPAEGLTELARLGEHGRRTGEVLTTVAADLWGGWALLAAGELQAATASLERAGEGQRLYGTTFGSVFGYSTAFSAMAWLERGDIARARATLVADDCSEGLSDGARFWLATRAEVALGEGDPQLTLELAGRLEPMRPPQTHPVWASWRSLRARALAQLGDREAAAALAAEELALARLTGAGWVIGRGLRQLGELTGDAAALREAVALLDASSARLERAKAHAALAAATSGAEAATALATARELAARCGAEALAAG